MITHRFKLEKILAAYDAFGRAAATKALKVIIEACRPFPWLEKFPPTSALSLEEARAIEEKWGEVLK